MAYMCRKHAGECDGCGDCGPTPIYACAGCGDHICDGDDYYEICGRRMCTECVEAARCTAELEEVEV